MYGEAPLLLFVPLLSFPQFVSGNLVISQIEEVMSNIPKGYKQTEVGVIPEDWDVTPIGELFTFSGGLSASRDQLSNVGR
ncbi:MAG: hypothetical protein HZA08_08225 [Nitrospirae bacterium]|nr:hypothetical protein [Nitrospirota bacterium]